ncbi:hypothetical protein ACIO52_20610 [Nocardia sp. NPDC087230]|uniref:hypothetical protein n=1 Tax=Nocardia sp. NPDC087230 TaxID=3364331 RepID=UPI00380B9F17
MRIETGKPMWHRWIAFVTVGEFLGFSLPAIVATALWERGGWPATTALLAAGLGEGIVLGWFQARALRPALPELPGRAWIAATALGAAIAWSVAMVPVGTDGFRGWPTAAAIPVLCAGGAVVVSAIGVAQWSVLRRYLARAGWWIGATALSWAAGLVAFALFTSPLWQPGQQPVEIALIGLAGGLLMAFVMAGVSGGFLVWLLRAQAEDGR